MNIFIFENTDIVTTSGNLIPAIEQAKADARNGAIADSAGTLIIDLF